MPKTCTAVAVEQVTGAIHVVRAMRVILDSDLARLYEVPTKQLNRAVRRNPERFPADFMFQLTREDVMSIRCQTGTLKQGQHRKYRPYAFTEQGVAMLSGLLNSPRAVRVNVEIMRAFVRLRAILGAHAELAHRLEELEARYDEQFKTVFDVIRDLTQAPPEPPRRRIGYGEIHEAPGRYRTRRPSRAAASN